MSEISKREIEEVDDQEDFRDPKVTTDPKHDKAKEEQVVCDKVRANIACSTHILRVFGEQTADIAELEDKQHKPIQGRDHAVHRERRGVLVFLLPKPVAVRALMFARLVKRVVHRCKDRQEPCNECQDPVAIDAKASVLFTARKRVHFFTVSVILREKGGGALHTTTKTSLTGRRFRVWHGESIGTWTVCGGN